VAGKGGQGGQGGHGESRVSSNEDDEKPGGTGYAGGPAILGPWLGSHPERDQFRRLRMGAAAVAAVAAVRRTWRLAYLRPARAVAAAAVLARVVPGR
jgi:hypothetical protein